MDAPAADAIFYKRGLIEALLVSVLVFVFSYGTFATLFSPPSSAPRTGETRP